MKNFLFLVLVLVDLIYQNECEQECFNYIKKLADKDKCLSSRIFDKKANALKYNNTNDFFLSVISSRCSGDSYACGKTMSWVSEVFEGLANQYNEAKLDDYFDGSKFGYVYLMGDDLRNFFMVNTNKSYPVIYRLRFTGNEDHVWVIEQLESNKGYRIYQSYHEAYSLKAWLSTSLDDLYNAENGDIMMINEQKAQANLAIQGVTLGLMDLSSDFDESPFIPDITKSYLRYIRDYNQTIVVNNLKRAWTKYGKGQIIDLDSFQIYLNTLADMTAYFKMNNNGSRVFSEKVWNDWIDLFGSPNPVHFPNVPHDLLLNLLDKSQNFRFEIKKVEFIVPPNCFYNSYYIR